jgi:hypothetical protein
VKGDTIKVAVYPSGQDVNAADEYCYFSGAKLANPQTIQQDEFVGCSYNTNAGQALTSAAAVLKYEDLIYDSHSAYNVATGLFTAPVSGYYHIKGCAATAQTLSTGESFLLAVYQSGAEVTRNYVIGNAAAGNAYVIEVSNTVFLAKGATLGIYVLVSTNTGTLVATATRNNMQITRLK